MADRWMEAHGKGKDNRPGMQEVEAYLGPEGMDRFSRFAGHLAREYNLSAAPAAYTATAGWVFRFARSGVQLMEGITLSDGVFHVEGIAVRDEASLQAAIELADRMHADGFLARYEAHRAEKGAKQAEATRRRLVRERAEKEALASLIVPDQLNRFRWSPKVQRRTLQRLYESDAAGLADEALVDDVGITLYLRCLQGQEEYSLMEKGQIKCHNCGRILPYQDILMECECGRQYQLREYMRSFRRNNMPSGSATHIFGAYIRDWPRAKTYAEKMRVVDTLVHEFHINLVTGVKGRFVGINLIEGTKKQIEALILSLAYGDEAGRETKEAFARNLQRL